MLSVKEFGGQNKMFNNLTFYTDGACCAGRQKTAGGLHWIYLEEGKEE